MSEEEMIAEYKLSKAMVTALSVTPLDGIMAAGATRAALMRRGLVIKRGKPYGRFGYLTEDGRKVAGELQR